jgi:hypothetical protein
VDHHSIDVRSPALRQRRWTRVRLVISAALAAALTASLLHATAAQAKPETPEHLAAQETKIDKDGGEVAGKGWPTRMTPDLAVPAPVWPAPGAAKVAARSVASTGKEQATVSVVDRATVPAAWRKGVVMRVDAAGKAAISVDYNSFRYAYGANWASRLRLWSLPACAECSRGVSRDAVAVHQRCRQGPGHQQRRQQRSRGARGRRVGRLW